MKTVFRWAAIAAVTTVTAVAGKAEALFDTEEVFRTAYGEDFAVDGDMTKAVWKEVPAVTNFTKKGKTAVDAAFRSEVKLRYSKTALYIGATFYQPMETLEAKYDQDDLGIWGDDCLEIFLVLPDESGPQICQFVVNALGSVYDAKEGRKSWWVSGRRTAAKRYDDRWSFEMKLPYKGLGIERPFAGDALGVRFCRSVHGPKPEVSTVPHMVSGAHGVRKYFGKLAFEPPTGDGAAALAAEAEAYRKDAVAKRIAKLTDETEDLLAGLEASVPLFKAKKCPVYDAAEAEIAKMRTAYGEFQKSPSKDVARMQELKKLQDGFRRTASRAAYVVWEADKWANGSVNDLPPDSVSETPLLRFEQAGNEREAVCLEFAGLLAVPRLDLRIVPDTLRDKGAFVKFSHFEIYEEPFIYYDSQVITAPLVRKDDNMITLTPGRPVRVWIVFNSRGVKPGTYPMTLKLKPANDALVDIREMKAEVKVWNFTLPETHEWPLPTFFWGPDVTLTDEVQTLKLMHDHHVTHGWTIGHHYWGGLWEGDYYAAKRMKYEHDFDPELAETAGQEFFETAKKLKMKFVFGWGTPHSPEWFRLMSDRLRKLGFGYDEFIFKSLIADEFQKADIPKLAAAREKVAALEEAKKWWFQAVYLSTLPPCGATMDDIEAAKLPEFYRMWTVIHGLLADPKRGPDVLKRLRAKGSRVWSYKCNTCMQRQSVLGYYRLWLWDCYLRGLDGAAMWCSGSHNRRGTDGFDSRDGYDDGILWEGNDGKMIPTKRFAAFCEGLEDVAYMDALRKAQARRTAVSAEEDPEAAELLARCPGIQKANNQQLVDRWRLEAGRTIDRLAKTDPMKCVRRPDAFHDPAKRRHTGIPSIAVSPKNGRLWATYYGGITPNEDENNYVTLTTSADGGKTWKTVLVADPDEEGPMRAFDPQVWVSPDGKLRWSWSEHDCGDRLDPKRDTLWMATLDAENEPAKIPEPRRIGRGVMMGKPLALKDGTWLLPASFWYSNPSACFYASKDRGRTFKLLGGVSVYPKENRLFDEHNVVELKNGDLLATLRTKKDPSCCESVSHDGGTTWSVAKKARFEHTSSRHFLRRLKSGNLLLVKNGPVDQDVGRKALTAFVSEDDGATWKGGLVLDERTDVSYPDGDQSADGSIYIVYDRNRTSDQEILFAKITEAEILSGRLSSPDSFLKRTISPAE